MNLTILFLSTYYYSATLWLSFSLDIGLIKKSTNQLRSKIFTESRLYRPAALFVWNWQADDIGQTALFNQCDLPVALKGLLKERALKTEQNNTTLISLA